MSRLIAGPGSSRRRGAFRPAPVSLPTGKGGFAGVRLRRRIAAYLGISPRDVLRAIRQPFADPILTAEIQLAGLEVQRND